ncbi:uncharacterized protein LOC143024411 [Oratosquilla oratoria]|uniref:uncharacterized protein LOC143024411 n=1 Tax=Oratosquilla oratoria TaxID=337810 RepID=UPI003F75E359
MSSFTFEHLATRVNNCQLWQHYLELNFTNVNLLCKMSKWKNEYNNGRRYVKEWEEKFAWLTLVGDKCYCKLCKCSLSNMKKSALEQHEKATKHIKAVQLGSPLIRPVNRHYVKEWEECFNWLKFVDNSCYCRVCNCTLSNMKKSALAQHEKSVKHNKAVNMFSSPVKTITLKVDPSVCGEVNDVTHLGTLLESYHGAMQPAHIGFIGCGNMAQALLSGFIKNGLVDPTKVIVSAPSDKNLSKIRNLGITTTHDNDFVVASSDLIFLSVKPEVFKSVINDLKPIEGDRNPLFVSTIGGLTIHDLEMKLLPVTATPRVVRTMPNTPSMVSQGCCVYSLGSRVTLEEGHVVQELLSAVGICEMVPEHQINAVAGLSSSGPAYIYMAIEALTDGGVKMGLPRQLAQTLAVQMVKGAASMVAETGKHPAQLRDEVCSSGGTTIAAVHSLEKNGLRSALISAVEVSANKSLEIGKR